MIFNYSKFFNLPFSECKEAIITEAVSKIHTLPSWVNLCYGSYFSSNNTDEWEPYDILDEIVDGLEQYLYAIQNITEWTKEAVNVVYECWLGFQVIYKKLTSLFTHCIN